MARFLKNRQSTIGKAPGTLTFIGRKKMETPRIRMISYDNLFFHEGEYATFAEAREKIVPGKINWINIDGIHDPEVIAGVCTHFGIPPLAQEDIVNTDQHPKLIDEDNVVVLILKVLSYKAESKSISSDQITLALGKNFVITFQESVGQFFNPIRERLRQNSGKIRSNGADYLLYRLIDAVADNYLVAVGELGELIEKNEEQLRTKTGKNFVNEVYAYKTEISFLRKVIRPVKEVTKLLKNSDTELIDQSTQPFLDHLDDLLTHTLETVEIYYTMISDQLMVYNTNLNNRSNEVMKVLTIYASIFIPLTFIAGVYGTNFAYVPEYQLKYGYFIMWGVMIVIGVVMLIYFRRKKWL